MNSSYPNWKCHQVKESTASHFPQNPAGGEIGNTAHHNLPEVDVQFHKA